MPHFHLISNGKLLGNLTTSTEVEEEVVELARPFASEEADLEIKMEKDGKLIPFSKIIRDTTLDGLTLCPKCGSQMGNDKFGCYCPECDYRVDF